MYHVALELKKFMAKSYWLLLDIASTTLAAPQATGGAGLEFIVWFMCFATLA